MLLWISQCRLNNRQYFFIFFFSNRPRHFSTVIDENVRRLLNYLMELFAGQLRVPQSLTIYPLTTMQEKGFLKSMCNEMEFPCYAWAILMSL